MNYLIVEDEFIIRTSVLGFLRSHRPDLNCHGQFDSLEQLESFSDYNEIGMIFMDIHLMDGCGFQFISTLRARTRKNIPVIFITAYREYEKAISALPAAACIRKPIQKEFLLEAIDQLLSDAKAKAGE